MQVPRLRSHACTSGNSTTAENQSNVICEDPFFNDKVSVIPTARILSLGHSFLLHLLFLLTKVLRASVAREGARDHSSLAGEPEIEATSAIGPSIQLPPSPHAIDYISLKMGSVAPY